ncbi:hypothetical protein BH10ACT11_BH10ACT11_15250 [soil metagenome]
MLAARVKTGFIALLAASLLALAGCSSDSEKSSTSTTTKTEKPTSGSTGASAAAKTTTPSQSPATPEKVKVAKEKAGSSIGDDGEPAKEVSVDDAAEAHLYFTSCEQFRPFERKSPDGENPLRFAAEAVVDGPTAAERSSKAGAQTQIPAATGVDEVKLADDGTATVAVSPQFLDGVPADPSARSDEQEASLDARLGQITYTLAAFKQVKATEVVSGGVAITSNQKPGDYAKPAGNPPKITHRKGPKTAGTRLVQRKLAKLKYLPKSAVDGVAGYRTQQAVTAFQAWEGLGRDGVVGPLTTAALHKAKRPKPGKRGPARRIEVYRAKGVILMVDGGKLKRAIHVSSGKPGYDTPTGSYSVFRKELKSWSVPFSTWLPYASYFNNGIAFHEYPDVPAYPASHGCVRVPSPEAKIVYRFAKLGTAVVVY